MSESAGRAVLVTGAGSGIGRATAERLAKAGYRVFAGARQAHHLDELRALAGVEPLSLDVRDPARVADAVGRVRETGLPLAGLLQCAGVGGIGYLHTFTDEEVRNLFETNVFAVVRLTNACLPLLLESRGRVIVVGSQGGHVSMRFLGPYTMTKHALEAYIIALDEELSPHGVRAVLVDPGGVRTSIGEKSAASDRARFERANAPFRETARQVLEGMQDPLPEFDPSRPESPANRNPVPAEAVAGVLETQLTAADPPLRVIVGTTWEGTRIFRELARRMAQVNRSPQHRHARDELVAYLDAALRDGEPS